MSESLQAFQDRRTEVITLLDELRAHAAAVGTQSLAGRLQEELVDKLAADRFHLVVVGEFNHGKTSFVNALLGKAVLPVGVTPTTAVIHHVHHAPEPFARVVASDGSERNIAFDEVAQFRLRADEAAGGGAEEAQHLEVGYPAELLRERIVLVDTPGVNDLCLQRADITYKYIPQSDAVLFVIDAGQPLKESERIFLKEKLIGQSRDKIIFVVAKTDIWSDEQRAEALSYIREELAKLIDSPVLFPISPQQALDGDLDESGVPALVAHLQAFLAEERGRIVLDNALGEGLEAARSVEHAIDARRRAARMSSEEIDRRIASIKADLAGQEQTVEERRTAIREEVGAIRGWVRRDIDRFCDDVIRQLPDLIDGVPVDEVKIYLPTFLEQTFASWAQKETQEVARALEQLAEKTIALMREDASEAAKRLSETLGSEVRPPDVRIDTFGYDFGVFALFTVGLGMMFSNLLLGALLTVAAPVLALYLKDKVEAETRAKAKELAAAALREAGSRVAPKLEEMVEQFAGKLDQWVVTTGRQMHQELIDVLDAARSERTEALPDVERATTHCNELADALAGIRGRLSSQRAALWGADEAEAEPAIDEG